jgi:hypothetical protein
MERKAKENTELKEGLNSTEFLLAADYFYNSAIYAVVYQRF